MGDDGLSCTPTSTLIGPLTHCTGAAAARRAAGRALRCSRPRPRAVGIGRSERPPARRRRPLRACACARGTIGIGVAWRVAVRSAQVCARCLSLRSLWVKLGQYLGGRADLTPPSWTAALQTLQVRTPKPLPLSYRPPPAPSAQLRTLSSAPLRSARLGSARSPSVRAAHARRTHRCGCARGLGFAERRDRRLARRPAAHAARGARLRRRRRRRRVAVRLVRLRARRVGVDRASALRAAGGDRAARCGEGAASRHRRADAERPARVRPDRALRRMAQRRLCAAGDGGKYRLLLRQHRQHRQRRRRHALADHPTAAWRSAGCDFLHHWIHRAIPRHPHIPKPMLYRPRVVAAATPRHTAPRRAWLAA